MYILAVRTYEPWTIGSILGGLVLFALFAALLILAVQRGNRERK